ncbi:MAG TPA: rhodanese-like domain-containing protein [Acidiferrobacteraceae bacterium]|nr:rhodanese-like domain-containing protein [Acidiferrobacteraceae bacterium]
MSITHFVVLNWYLFVMLAVVVGLLVSGPLRQKLLGVENVGTGQAIQIVNHKAGVFVDVREAQEYTAGHIPKARNIPLSRMAQPGPELAKLKDRPVVLYCRSGQRSARAAALLRKQGFTSVYNLAGGFTHWQNENLPSER